MRHGEEILVGEYRLRFLDGDDDRQEDEPS
jgi:hypothetical protein